MSVEFNIFSPTTPPSLLPTFIRSNQSADSKESSLLSSAFEITHLFFSSLFKPFIDLHKSGAVKNSIRDKVEKLSDFEGVKELTCDIVTTVAKHPLDAISLAAPIFSPETGALIRSMIGTARCYKMVNLSLKDLQNLLTCPLTGKVLIVLIAASLPVAYGTSYTCQYPNMREIVEDPNVEAFCDPTLTYEEILSETEICAANCDTPENCVISIEHVFARHSPVGPFISVSTTGTCPEDKACFLVAPHADKPPIEFCYDLREGELIPESVSAVHHSTPSTAFEGMDTLAPGSGNLFSKIRGCINPVPPHLCKKELAHCSLISYTHPPYGSFEMCVSSSSPHAHRATFSLKSIWDRLLGSTDPDYIEIKRNNDMIM